MLQLDIKSAEGAILTRLSGELDRSAREPLLKAVRAEAEAKGGKVVLDCSNLSALDSEGVRALLALQTWLRIKDSEMAIAALPARLEETIKSDSGVDKFLNRHPSVKDAMVSLGLGSAKQAPPSVIDAPPPVIDAPPPVIDAPPSMQTPPPVPAEPAASGGWGAPPITPDPPAASTSVRLPNSESATPPSASPDPWVSPIQTPELDHPPMTEVKTPEPEPESPAPAGAWGTPAPAAVPSSAPPTTEPAAWQSAAGPTPRLGRQSAKKGKLGFILGGIAVLVIVVLFIIPSTPPPPRPQTFGPPEIVPPSYLISGRAGETPNPAEVTFTITNALKDSIKPTADELPAWAKMTPIRGTEAKWTITFTFETLPNTRPEQERFYVKAAGLDGGSVIGDVILDFEDPDEDLEISPLPLRHADVGSDYDDSLSLVGGGTATFEVVDGALPAGISLRVNGAFTGVPSSGAVGRTYDFTVRATRGTQSTEWPFAITVKEPDDSPEAGAKTMDIVSRIENLDRKSMDSKTREEIDKFRTHLPRILADPSSYVKLAAQITFPIGRSTADKGAVQELLNADELRSWVGNTRIRYLVAGFADSATGNDDLNRNIIKMRAQGLASAVRDWLVRTQGMTSKEAHEKVVVIPNKPSNDFTKSRAAECWLFLPPIVN